MRKRGSTSEPVLMYFLFDITHCPTRISDRGGEALEGCRNISFKVQIFCGNQFCTADSCLPRGKDVVRRADFTGITSICLKETPIATHQNWKQRRGTDPRSVWAISRWHGVRWNRIKKQEHKTQVTETEPQISQSIEMTGDVGNVEKFPPCEFRFYEVLAPKTDTLPLAIEEPSLRNRKKGKGPLSAVNLKLVNVCLQMAERGFCVRKGFSLGASLRPGIHLFKSPNSCNIKLTVAQLVILSA